MDLLRDPIWQFIGAMIGAAAILVTIYLFLLQLPRKSLSYMVLATTPLVSVEEEIRANVRITFDGKPIQDVCLVILRLANDGNIPIIASDFEQPITLSFGEGNHILSAQLIDATTPAFAQTISITQSHLTVRPALWNVQDSITVKLFLSRQPEAIQYDAHIAGVKEIKKDSLGIMKGNVADLLISMREGAPGFVREIIPILAAFAVYYVAITFIGLNEKVATASFFVLALLSLVARILMRGL